MDTTDFQRSATVRKIFRVCILIISVFYVFIKGAPRPVPNRLLTPENLPFVRIFQRDDMYELITPAFKCRKK
jgi:hypothetical protein